MPILIPAAPARRRKATFVRVARHPTGAAINVSKAEPGGRPNRFVCSSSWPQDHKCCLPKTHPPAPLNRINLPHALIKSHAARILHHLPVFANISGTHSRASTSFRYELDTFVRHLLADHKDLLRSAITAKEAGETPDIFVEVGWPNALRLVFTMEQAIR
jgi:hypothetical protein